MSSALGLPAGIRACLFDLDGVLTDTARLHAAAWKEVLDPYLAARGEPPFDAVDEYRLHVDGRPSGAGVAAFLVARGNDQLVRIPRLLRREGRGDVQHVGTTSHGLSPPGVRHQVSDKHLQS